MEINIKAIGKKILEMVKECLYGIMEILMMVNGSIIRNRDLEFMLNQMEIVLKDNGIKIK